MTPKYLFITEGGEQVFVVSDEITEHDKKCVAFGHLSIVRLADLHEMNQRGEWEQVEVGVLHSDPSNEGLGPYHHTR